MAKKSTQISARSLTPRIAWLRNGTEAYQSGEGRFIYCHLQESDRSIQSNDCEDETAITELAGLRAFTACCWAVHFQSGLVHNVSGIPQSTLRGWLVDSKLVPLIVYLCDGSLKVFSPPSPFFLIYFSCLSQSKVRVLLKKSLY